MINIFRVIRTNDWWDGKLSPLMAIGYGTLLLSKAAFINNLPYLLFLISALVIGAVYVSIINDITDLKEDSAAGKVNRMVPFTPACRTLLVAGCFIAGGFIEYLLYPDTLSILFYTLPWISFSLYSIPPVRLKNRGFWGVIADAAGSHLFPCCLIIQALSFHLHQHVNLIWLGAVATWSLAWGIRGILWHQFYDREKDLQAGINTYASKLSPASFKSYEIMLMSIEFMAIMFILLLIAQPVAYLFMGAYLIYVLARSKLLGVNFIFITMGKSDRYQIFMNDYYALFLPASLVLTVLTQQPYAWFVLLLQVILFVTITKETGVEILRIFRVLRRSAV